MHLMTQAYKEATARTIYPFNDRLQINHLDLRQYLNYLFAALPNLPVPGDLTVLQDYLPWSPKVQEICHE
ncbi:hypothetical protein FMM01_07360 [Schleiferilactobacillus harbinensis]|uniref:hypothetical protein n=1 Tax=Schleiferilactobacillus harbinensis TaxID=304207 RepID=UPI001238E8F0|nr:hypothetical protein [Schleiferilactobacillus harbinensis]QEU47123.1 hypothetical protein FMM01_07360 [Schleiferilactobacillus harbinensis]